jgi:GT2 family glycosyltransferase
VADPRPPIAVVIPLYNKRDWIRRCLDSIQSQTFQEFEACIVDDGSTDDSDLVAAAFKSDPRFRLIRQENRGVAAARNKGIAETTAPLVAFLDADDEWEPGFLDCIVALTHRYPEAAVFASAYRRCFGPGQPTDCEIVLRLQGHRRAGIVDRYLRYMPSGDFISSSSVAIRREVLVRERGFPEGVTLGEDRDLWARIGIAHSLAYDPRVLATYHCWGSPGPPGASRSAVPFPHVVRTLRRLLPKHAGDLETALSIYRYVDTVLVQHAYVLVARRQQRQLIDFLGSENWNQWPYRLTARWLRIAAVLVPLKLLDFVRANSEYIARRFAGESTQVVHRTVSCVLKAKKAAASGAKRECFSN